MYFVNLKNKHSSDSEGGGFVVVSGDRRFIPVLAYGEKGGLYPDNLNPGLEIWINYVKTVYERVKYKEERSEGAEYLWDNFKINFGSKGRLTDDEYGGGCPPDYDNTYGPHIYTHWSQKHPYNFSSPASSVCPSYYCNKAPAGCGPVAIAQVWNYYGKPESYPTGCGDWTMPGPCTGFYDYPLDSVLPSSYSCSGFDGAPLREKQIAYLISNAGNAATSKYNFLGNCNTLTDRPDVKNAFAVRGYSNHGSRGGYMSNLNTLKNELRTGHPAIMDGNTSFNFDNWHIWVVDGLREIMYYYANSYPEGSCTGIGTTYMHLNWGWGNASGEDSWYAFNNFTPIGQTEEYDYALNVTYGMRP